MKSHIRCSEKNSNDLTEIQRQLERAGSKPSIYHLGNLALAAGIPIVAKREKIKLKTK